MLRRASYIQAIKEISFRHEKMAFLTGPRQVGKTTLSQMMKEHYPKSYYYNWDDVEFQRLWIKNPKELIPQDIGPKVLLILDELHKAPRWKNHLKGLYDLKHSDADILVTGSARLNVFRRGGDSLLGRYFLFHLHPFSLGEIHSSVPDPKKIEAAISEPLKDSKKDYDNLLRFGGFPDPLTQQSEEHHRLWQRMRMERLIREDLTDLSHVQELGLIQTMASLLPEKVGSPFSYQSLAEDLSVSNPTIKRWFQWLEQLFFVFPIYPYTGKIARSLKKQPKIYLWDWSAISNSAARFENLVASHLYKTVQWWNDTGKGDFALHYLRDKGKNEVDFLVTQEGKPWLLIECKENDLSPAPALHRFSQALKPNLTLQLVSQKQVQRKFDLVGGKKGFVVSADRFLPLFF